MALLSTQSFYGQSDPTNDEAIEELDAFEVTGSFAGSLAAATEAKKIAPLVVEALVAEDIGKLPDTSIAESLSRLPGLTSQRVNGRSQVISIRGFPGDFATGLLNGREQATTSSNRNIEFDQYPAELLNGALVYKTTNASLVNQGLSGTVDLKTVRPLDYGKRAVAANLFYEWTGKDALNAGSNKGGWRGSATYIDQFNDDTVGLALGYAYMNKPGQGEQWNAWGYPTVTDPNDPSQSAFLIGGAKPFVRSSELIRNSFMGSLQNKVSDNVKSTVDLFYSKFEETQLLRGIEIPLAWSSAQFQAGSEVVRDGLVESGTFGNVFGVVRNDIVEREADIFSGGWNLEFSNLGNWTITTDLSLSQVEREDIVLETYSGTGSNQSGTPDVIDFSLVGGTGAVFTPTIDYTDTNVIVLTGPQGWGGDIVPGGQLGYLKTPTTEDKVWQAQAAAEYAMDNNWLDSLTFGLGFTSRTKDEYELGDYIAGANGATEIPFESIGNTDLSFIGIPGMASYDPIAQLNSGVYEVIINPNADVQAADWEVEEELINTYVQANVNTMLGNMPVTGDIGLQYVHTDQSSTGLAASGTGSSTVSEFVTDSYSYDDWLPSMNLNFNVADGHFVRFYAGRQVMRQRMSNMRAGFQWSYDEAKADINDPIDGPWSGSGGNTQLEPWRADAFDLSWEWYFPDGAGYLAVAGFYKNLKTYTFTEKQLADFTGFPITGDEPATRTGTLDVPTNGSGGQIKGLEFSLSLPGETFADVLTGFGFLGNYALTDSSVQPNPGNPSEQLPGFSKHAGSVTLYYERYGFSARLSARYRDDYRANVSTFGPRGEDFRTVTAETLIDAQVSYAFGNGPLEGLTIIAQGYNLNDEPLFTFENDDERLVRDYQSYGPSYSIGASYKF